MADFSSLLRKPAGEAKRPPVLPPGNYLGIIKSFELGDQNKNNTPYVRLHVGYMGFPDDVAAEDREGIDLAKRQGRRDYYLTEDALWRLDEMLRACGVEPSGRDYESCLPELQGKQVVVEVKQYLNKSNNELGNEIGKIAAA